MTEQAAATSPPAVHSIQDNIAPVPLSRHNTGSTTSSRLYQPILPGFYTLPIHGNCPRCRHHHQAALVRVRISGDFSRVSHVDCEHCGERWLAFGGNRSTACISLLSAQTIELDPVQMDVRHSLIEMVRSATAVASPILASVPESLSRLPSRGPSVRAQNHNIGSNELQADIINTSGSGELRTPSAAMGSDRDTPAEGPQDAAQSTKHLKGKKKHKDLIMLISSRLKSQFALFKKLHVRHWTRSTKTKREMKATQYGEAPFESVLLETKETKEAPSNFVANAQQHEPSTEAQNPRSTELDNVIGAPQRNTATSEPTSAFDTTKEELRNMSKEQRHDWIRKQFSVFRCPCPFECECKQNRNSVAGPSVVNGSSTSLRNPSPSLQDGHFPFQTGRTRSHELLGLGSHLDFPAGAFFHTDHYSIPSTSTSLSQAATVVDGMTATSGSRNLYLDIVQQERNRSRSPRPHSLPPAWLPPTLLRRLRDEDAEDRASVHSLATSEVARSPNGMQRQGTDPSAIMSPQQTSVVDRLSSFTEPIFEANGSRVSIPYVNGFRTSDNGDPASPPSL